LSEYRHRSFQFELMFFGHKQRKCFHVVDEDDFFLLASIGQVIKALLRVVRLLQEQFLEGEGVVIRFDRKFSTKTFSATFFL